MVSRSIWILPLTIIGATALADESPEAFPSVTVQAQKDGELPSQPVVNVGSPQSAIGAAMIHEIASPVGDYGTVANFTPSFVSTAPNGPGFDAAKNQSL